MSMVTHHLRISSIIALGRSFGGAIFGGVTETGESVRVKCDYNVMRDSSSLHVGQCWTIIGNVELYGGMPQINATSIRLERPTGRNVIEWIACSKECPGIGRVRATKLYNKFGPDLLIEHIKNRNIDELSKVLAMEAADNLCDAFEKYKVLSTLNWLDQLEIPRGIGQKLVTFYKHETQNKIESNPYRLISFDEKWERVDKLAQQRFGICHDDPRRLDAAIEEALYRGVANGHTCLTGDNLEGRLKTLLGSTSLAREALRIDSTQYRNIDGTHYQATGMHVIEQFVATRLCEISRGETAGQLSLLSGDMPDEITIESVIKTYEAEQGFDLTMEQQAAVLGSVQGNLSLILGGAGTGKTTVLKALYRALEVGQPDIAIYQLALAGRAAQRMSEASGRDSMTITGFLNNIDFARLGYGTVVVIDEMSMVDVLLMYRLLRHIPSGTKLVLVGDPAQLPPIGPGLVLHALAGHPAITQTELKVTKRQSLASGIPSVATAIREHRVPEFAEYRGKGSGVSFIACPNHDIENTVKRVYEDLGGDGTDYSVQILSITRSAIGGVKNLNASLHNQYRASAEKVFCHDAIYGLVGASTLEKLPLKIGDLVIYTKNDYDLGLRNGSLGVIVHALHVNDANSDCCVCDFDGVAYTLKTKHLYALQHAYSITIHKSQGSQFTRVIIPIRKSRLLDQALLYTAVTRAVEQVVLIGDIEAAIGAIERVANAEMRNITLPKLLN